MPSTSSLVAFAALSFALIVVPGPSVLFVVGRAVSHGRRAALTTVAGNALGVFLQVVLVAVGLGVIIERSIAVFTVVKLAGAAYLVWLGVQAVRHRRALTHPRAPAPVDRSPGVLFVDGVVVGVANPKAIVFFAAVLPQYVEPGGAPAGLQMVLLGLVFVVIALASDSVWGVAAGTARTWLARTPERLVRLRAAGGLVMVALGLNLALSGRHD